MSKLKELITEAPKGKIVDLPVTGLSHEVEAYADKLASKLSSKLTSRYKGKTVQVRDARTKKYSEPGVVVSIEVHIEFGGSIDAEPGKISDPYAEIISSGAWIKLKHGRTQKGYSLTNRSSKIRVLD